MNLLTPTVAQSLRQSNLLLGKLRDEDWDRLVPKLRITELARGEVLQKAGETVTRTFFPCDTASAGFRVWSDAGVAAVDVVTVGREGAVGGIVSNGHVAAYATAEVRSAGTFLTLRSSDLERAKSESVALRHWFARYADCLVAQLFQNSACNASHTIRQRAARWLLTMAARTQRPELPVTHEELAGLLGVGRSFVTRTLNSLVEEGFVATRRGHVLILNEHGLRGESCHCSDQIAAHYEAVLAGIYPVSPSDQGG